MTLVETIVATAILIAAITGPLALASQSIRASRDVRNQLIATNLASEGIEMIHNVISNAAADDTTLSGTAWLTGGGGYPDINAECTGATGCVLDVSRQSNPKVWANNAVSACGTGTQCNDRSKVFFDPTTGIYQQFQNGNPGGGFVRAPFRRVVTVTLVNAYQIRVISTVYYQKFNNTEGKVVLTEEMYNWFPEL